MQYPHTYIWAEDELLQVPHIPSLMGCRSVEEYDKLNAIAEGAYGRVYRYELVVVLDVICVDSGQRSWGLGR